MIAPKPLRASLSSRPPGRAGASAGGSSAAAEGNAFPELLLPFLDAAVNRAQIEARGAGGRGAWHSPAAGLPSTFSAAVASALLRMKLCSRPGGAIVPRRLQVRRSCEGPARGRLGSRWPHAPPRPSRRGLNWSFSHSLLLRRRPGRTALAVAARRRTTRMLRVSCRFRGGPTSLVLARSAPANPWCALPLIDPVPYPAGFAVFSPSAGCHLTRHVPTARFRIRGRTASSAARAADGLHRLAHRAPEDPCSENASLGRVRGGF